jgi:hypothetical protein
MTNSLPSLGPKETAKVIRQILRAAFPATKFSVTTSRGSMVSGVDIRWADGPTVKLVDSIVGQFEAGSFNGMTDSYEYDRDAVVTVDGVQYRPATRYVSTHRNTSVALARRAAVQVAEYWGIEVPVIVEGRYANWTLQDDTIIGNYSLSTMIHQAMGDRARFQRATLALVS